MKRLSPEGSAQFQQHVVIALIAWQKMQALVYDTIIACNEGRDFKILRKAYYAAEDASKEIGHQTAFLLHLLPPPPESKNEVEELEIQKMRGLIHFLDRSRDTMMALLMNAYSSWLREESLRAGLADTIVNASGGEPS